MRQVTADALISRFKQTARENQVGQRKAQKGTAESGGAFAYAMQKLGRTDFPNESNAIVRQCTGEIMPIKSAKPGYLCTRWKPEFECDELERRYGKDGLGNHYHIGLMGDDGKIYHEQGNGFADDSPEGWSYCFAIKGIDYSEERTDGAASVPQSVLLELADACLTLENLNTFADLAAAIAALQSAAKKTTAYLKGGK